MKREFRILCMIFLALLVTTRGNAQTVYRPYELGGIVARSFVENDFAALDGLAIKLRTEKSRTPSGLWNLSVFYSGLKTAMLEGRDENSDAQWNAIEKKINQWVATRPLSPVAPIALAIAQSRHAWALRGSGFANTVTRKGWEDFARHLAVARNTLEANKKISSDDPQWYVEMLNVALGLGWEKDQYMALYNEAASKEPLYYETYFAAVERLLPIWGGDIEQIQTFAADAVKRTASTEGQGMYARIYWVVAGRMGTKAFFAKPHQQTIWPQMKAGFDDVVKRYPVDWNRNAYAKFACQTGDVDLFISLVRQFDGEPMEAAWPRGYFQTCKDNAAAVRPGNPLQ